MKPGALLVVGTLLLVAGPAAPAFLGGGHAMVQLFDLGADGGHTRRALDEVMGSVKAPLSAKKVGPSLVEVSGPEMVLDGMMRPAAPEPSCDVKERACFDAKLHAHPMFNRAAGPIGKAQSVEKPAPRPLWLLGMMVGLGGLALVVMGLSRMRGVQRPSAFVLAGGVVGAVIAGGAGAQLGKRVEQILVVWPAHRPLLPEQPLTTDRLQYTQDVASIIAGPDMRAGLAVDVTATPDGAKAIVHVSSTDPGALDAFRRRVQERVVEVHQRDAASLVALLESAPDDVKDLANAMRASLVMPEMTALPVEADARGPVKGAASGALAGALVVWAAVASRKKG